MSAMGTGVAAGVAQTAHQAQQLARRKEKRLREDERPNRRVEDTYEVHGKVLEEHDDSESAPRLDVEPMQDHGHPNRPSLDVKA